VKRTGRALLLRRIPYGESSLTVQLFTREQGRVHVVAKGAYRKTSRFFCTLDLFQTLEVEWSASARSDLGTLTRADWLRRRRALTQDLERYRHALAALELSALAVRPEHPDAALFDALELGLDEVEAHAQPDVALVRFELAFLNALGIAPALTRCAACGGAAPALGRTQRAPFSAGAGGRLCARCGEEARASGRRVGTLPHEVLRAAEQLHGMTPAAALALRADPDGILLVRDFLERFIDYHLDTRPRCQRQFLAAANRNAPGREPRRPVLACEP